MNFEVLKRGEKVRFCILSVEQSEHRVPSEEFDRLCSLTKRDDFAIAAVMVSDPENRLSPWTAPAVFGNNDFGSGASETLEEILERVIPELDLLLDKPMYIIEGYSFAGLFALWAAYNSEKFCGVCAVSPSVWFPCWIEYAEGNRLHAETVYLSVGASEKKTRNRQMCRVEECLKKQYELSMRDAGVQNCRFELNIGNHFTDVPERRAKAMAFCLKTLCKNVK